MGKGVRDNMPLGSFLNPIVSDGAGSVQSLFDISSFQNPAGSMGLVSPDTGEAVRLELQPDRQFVGLGGTGPSFSVFHLLGDAQQGLDVMPHFVGHYVGLGEISLGLEARPQILKKLMSK